MPTVGRILLALIGTSSQSRKAVLYGIVALAGATLATGVAGLALYLVSRQGPCLLITRTAIRARCKKSGVHSVSLRMCHGLAHYITAVDTLFNGTREKKKTA